MLSFKKTLPKRGTVNAVPKLYLKDVVCAYQIDNLLIGFFNILSSIICLSFTQTMAHIRVKIHHLKVRFRIALGAGKMDQAFRTGRDKGLCTGPAGFLDAVGLNRF
jgi:hypothetical protein